MSNTVKLTTSKIPIKPVYFLQLERLINRRSKPYEITHLEVFDDRPEGNNKEVLIGNISTMCVDDAFKLSVELQCPDFHSMFAACLNVDSDELTQTFLVDTNFPGACSTKSSLHFYKKISKDDNDDKSFTIDQILGNAGYVAKDPTIATCRHRVTLQVLAYLIDQLEQARKQPAPSGAIKEL